MWQCMFPVRLMGIYMASDAGTNVHILFCTIEKCKIVSADLHIYAFDAFQVCILQCVCVCLCVSVSSGRDCQR